MALKIEKNATKQPKKPKCPDHGTDMKYSAIRGRWNCTYEDCKRIAYPPNDEDNTNPVLGKGELELLHIPDPEGSKVGRYLLRAMTNNVMLDITDYVAEGGVLHQPTKYPNVVTILGMNHYSELSS